MERCVVEVHETDCLTTQVVWIVEGWGPYIYIIYVAPAGVPFFYKFSQVYQYVIFPCTLSTQIRLFGNENIGND